MIPKTIHYCWFGGKPLPQDVKACIASWVKFCPDYEIRQWDESNYDVTAHPFMKAAYEAKAWAFVSDYARLQVVYENGGIYLDTDVELIKPLDNLLQEKCYFGIQQSGCFVQTGLGFGAEQGHPGVKAMINEYDAILFDPENKAKVACPYLNTHAMVEHGFVRQDKLQYLSDIGVTVYPSEYFDPYSPGNTKGMLSENTVSIHHYSASWLGNKTKLKRKILRLIGPKRVAMIKGVLRQWKK